VIPPPILTKREPALGGQADSFLFLALDSSLWLMLYPVCGSFPPFEPQAQAELTHGF